MAQTSSPAPTAVTRAVGVLLGAEAASFLVGAITHLGVGLPLGFGVLREPRIVDATIVEGLCALLLATAAYAVLTHRAWAWPAATTANGVAIVGVLAGIGALAAGLGPTTTTNTIYHRTILLVLVVGLALLQTPAAKAALGRGGPQPSRRTPSQRPR
jgi:hypothetical protein